MLRDIELHGIRKDFKIIPNVVDTRIFYPADINKKDSKRRLLFVGGLEPIKGIPYLLKALSMVKEKRDDFVLDIVGDGYKRSEYERIVNELKLNGHVIFHGLKSKEKVAEFMRQCDFFVLPSLWESQSCVLIEAMACGRPVITTSSGGTKEIVGEESGVIVPPKDVQALAEAIIYMLDNFKNYSHHKISQHAKYSFGHERVGKLLYNTYRHVVYKYKSRNLEYDGCGNCKRC